LKKELARLEEELGRGRVANAADANEHTHTVEEEGGDVGDESQQQQDGEVEGGNREWGAGLARGQRRGRLSAWRAQRLQQQHKRASKGSGFGGGSGG
jgi:hypothetical protein